jgi:preprotein translocase subunit SecA
MSNQKIHTSRSFCKALHQMHRIAQSLSSNSHPYLSYEDRLLMSYIDNKCHRLMQQIRIKHDLDIDNDFRPKGVDK